MAFGADSDARTRTYRLYVRQTKSGTWHKTIHSIEATADNYVERAERLANSRPNRWCRWWLLVGERDSQAAFTVKVVQGENGINTVSAV